MGITVKEKMPKTSSGSDDAPTQSFSDYINPETNYIFAQNDDVQVFL